MSYTKKTISRAGYSVISQQTQQQGNTQIDKTNDLVNDIFDVLKVHPYFQKEGIQPLKKEDLILTCIDEVVAILGRRHKIDELKAEKAKNIYDKSKSKMKFFNFI